MCITIDQIEQAFGLLLLKEFNTFVYCCTKCQCEYDSGPSLEAHILDDHQDDKGHIENVFVKDPDYFDDIEHKSKNCLSEQQVENCSKTDTVPIELKSINVKPESPVLSQICNKNINTKSQQICQERRSNVKKPLVQRKEKQRVKKKHKEKTNEKSTEDNEEKQTEESAEESNNDLKLDDDLSNESSDESDDTYKPSKKRKKSKKSSKNSKVSNKSNAERYYCDMCPSSFVYKTSLPKHMKRHIESRFRKACPICGVKAKDYEKHMKVTHTEKRPYKCDYCEKSFTTNASRRSHQRTHTGETPMLCSTCGKAFRSQQSQYRHQLRMHSDKLPHPCKECNRTFICPSQLQEHYYAFHSDERPYTCEICGNSYSTKKYLRKHKLSHGEKTHPCKYCDKMFKTTETRRWHERTVHKAV